MSNVDFKNKIFEAQIKFSEIYENYRISKYQLECKDDEYKDSEDNIFDDNRRWKLDQFIDLEAQLYRKSTLRYSEKIDIIKQLSNNITDWLKVVKGRKINGIEKAKRIFDSENYYLQDMKIRLKYYMQILEILSELDEFEQSMLDNGIELSSESEYETYILNKVILLCQVDYCKAEGSQLITELNERVGNSSLYTGEFYYKLAELNFELQKYKEAQQLLDRAITRFELDLTQQSQLDTLGYCQTHDMLFSSYQLKALGYEFCGDYEKAICFLTEKAPKELLDVFTEKISSKDLECLHYSSDTEGIDTKRKRDDVIERIRDLIKEDIFKSKISSYVYDQQNQKARDLLVDFENKNLMESINKSRIKDKYINKVFSINAINDADASLLYEFLHILAHCINEFGVTLIKSIENDFDEELANKMISLGRALMLYISDTNEIYKSCYATTYAEAGDTWIAKSELKNIIEDSDYARYDVTTKAEIAFFYYIISSMYLIENNALDINSEIDNNFYNRYLNYCYRSFDYDAITHMRLYKFKNKIAHLLQVGDLKEMANEFLHFSKQQSNERSAYQDFVSNVYFQKSNERLKCEYNKVKHMYRFLICFFNEFSEYDKKQFHRSHEILDSAFKYIHYYNANLHNTNSYSIQYLSFDNSKKDIETILNLIRGTEFCDNMLVSDHCRLIIIENENEISSFIEQLDKFTNETDKMFFLSFKDEKLMNCSKKILQTKKINIYPKFRTFDSVTKGLKEFIIFTTFFIIKDDFFNPYNIFVMTPIGTAKSCRYRISNNVHLITNCYTNAKDTMVGVQKEICSQYLSISKSVYIEEDWTCELNNESYAKNILFAISIAYDRDSRFNAIKYRYKYDLSDSWREACLFSPMKWHQRIENIYSVLKYESSKILEHRYDCKQGSVNCAVVLVDEKCIGEDDINISYNEFIDVMHSFINVASCKFKKVLVWRGTNGSHIFWRIVSLEEHCPINIMNKIKQTMCNKGEGPKFIAAGSSYKLKRYDWPEPYDYEKFTNQFLFVSHFGRDDAFVKQELNEFFVKHNVPIWYDKDKMVKEDTWKNRISTVINDEKCIGIVVLITNPDFFRSEAIQFELLEVSKVKNTIKENFVVLPIVYGAASDKDDLRNLIFTSIEDDNLAMSIKRTILPNKDKVVTFLRLNQTLGDYTQYEIDDGRNGSIITALKELNLI